MQHGCELCCPVKLRRAEEVDHKSLPQLIVAASRTQVCSLAEQTVASMVYGVGDCGP